MKSILSQVFYKIAALIYFAKTDTKGSSLCPGCFDLLIYDKKFLSKTTKYLCVTLCGYKNALKVDNISTRTINLFNEITQS